MISISIRIIEISVFDDQIFYLESSGKRLKSKSEHASAFWSWLQMTGRDEWDNSHYEQATDTLKEQSGKFNSFEDYHANVKKSVFETDFIDYINL